MKVIQNLSAVTAACMLTRRSLFEAVGGFDERFSQCFNDVDYCLRLGDQGYRVLYTPFAELYHRESLSRGADGHPETLSRFEREIALFREKWADWLAKGDPYYNPNLTRSREDFSLDI